MHLFRLLFLKQLNAKTIWDGNIGYVIRACSEEKARALANIEAEREGRIWNDPEKVSCEVITETGSHEIILTSFNGG